MDAACDISRIWKKISMISGQISSNLTILRVVMEHPCQQLSGECQRRRVKRSDVTRSSQNRKSDANRQARVWSRQQRQARAFLTLREHLSLRLCLSPLLRRDVTTDCDCEAERARVRRFR